LLFSLTSTVVLASHNATFGFPEIHEGVLPGLASVVAQRRLRKPLCERLMCTGDTIDAATAMRYGLVDFVGNTEEIEQQLQQLLEHSIPSPPSGALLHRTNKNKCLKHVSKQYMITEEKQPLIPVFGASTPSMVSLGIDETSGSPLWSYVVLQSVVQR